MMLMLLKFGPDCEKHWATEWWVGGNRGKDDRQTGQGRRDLECHIKDRKCKTFLNRMAVQSDVSFVFKGFKTFCLAPTVIPHFIA